MNFGGVSKVAGLIALDLAPLPKETNNDTEPVPTAIEKRK